MIGVAAVGLARAVASVDSWVVPEWLVFPIVVSRPPRRMTIHPGTGLLLPLELDDGQAAVPRDIYDRRRAPSSAVVLPIERGLSTLHELTVSLGRLAELGLVEIDVIGSLPTPSVTKQGRPCCSVTSMTWMTTELAERDP
jgi:hypothetical protein